MVVDTSTIQRCLLESSLQTATRSTPCMLCVHVVVRPPPATQDTCAITQDALSAVPVPTASSFVVVQDPQAEQQPVCLAARHASYTGPRTQDTTRDVYNHACHLPTARTQGGVGKHCTAKRTSGTAGAATAPAKHTPHALQRRGTHGITRGAQEVVAKSSSVSLKLPSNTANLSCHPTSMSSGGTASQRVPRGDGGGRRVTQSPHAVA